MGNNIFFKKEEFLNDLIERDEFEGLSVKELRGITEYMAEVSNEIVNAKLSDYKAETLIAELQNRNAFSLLRVPESVKVSIHYETPEGTKANMDISKETILRIIR